MDVQIIIKRYKKRKGAMDGVLFLENKRFCDTTEHSTTCLPAGKYKIRVKMERHLQRYAPKIYPMRGKKQQGIIKPGNGVYTLTDGSILVGKYQASGLCIHSATTLDRLVRRLRRATKQGGKISLNIVEVVPLT